MSIYLLRRVVSRHPESAGVGVGQKQWSSGDIVPCNKSYPYTLGADTVSESS